MYHLHQRPKPTALPNLRERQLPKQWAQISLPILDSALGLPLQWCELTTTGNNRHGIPRGIQRVVASRLFKNTEPEFLHHAGRGLGASFTVLFHIGGVKHTERAGDVKQAQAKALALTFFLLATPTGFPFAMHPSPFSLHVDDPIAIPFRLCRKFCLPRWPKQKSEPTKSCLATMRKEATRKDLGEGQGLKPGASPWTVDTWSLSVMQARTPSFLL